MNQEEISRLTHKVLNSHDYTNAMVGIEIVKLCLGLGFLVALYYVEPTWALGLGAFVCLKR